ncbi:MAG: hypothetical protein BGO69_06585 [Bacteroidetes bacterium 46-16]|nr:MAG: hypothetical protein BGO69_06585 [Bacteroidetes bacterium 46-16]
MRRQAVQLFFITILLLLHTSTGYGVQKVDIETGAEQLDRYIPMLKNKRVGLLINQTSVIGDRSLLDVLLEKHINVVKIFVPEHGFRGTADAGAHINNAVDKQSGLPIISLYGNNKKPAAAQLKDIDILVYDLQDVGARFYTYISTLQYAMEACADNGKKIMVLDRPDPNGFYVDGPILDKIHSSFVGMQPVPVVYGMTAGEYAKMLVGEQWLATAKKPELTVIPCSNYDHTKKYELPVAPSPNLKTMAAIYLYPSLCFFEGTPVSVGRGTDKPFQQWGHPDFKGKTNYFFIPKSKEGASKPLLEGQDCWGKLLAVNEKEALDKVKNGLNLEWLIQAYKWYPDKEKFFSGFFEKLAGTSQLREQIDEGLTAEEIRAKWQNDIDAFKKIRKKYLLYPDFE